MADALDMDLVREFARDHSEAAFTELVRRHLNLVYSIARRCTNSDGDAQDVVQAVFVILARKAAGLRPRTVLTGWLYETTRYTSACLQRTNARRHARDQEAYMQSTLTDANTAADWHRLAPYLEAAMSQLGERDRTLLALRFYENKSGPEAAALLGISEAATHKRTARALEKLRNFFTRRGVALSAAAIAGAVSANSVQAAPVGLAPKVFVIAAKGAAIAISTASMVHGTLKTLAWAKYKTFVAYGVAALIAGTAVIIVLPKKPASPPGANVFNSFDAHNKFDKSVSWAVMNDGQAGYRGQAEWFVPTGSGPLNVVDLAMMGKGSINITVAEDKNDLPGKVLESFLNIPSSHFGKSGHLVLVSEAHPALSAGTKYWLCVEPADSDTGCSWCYNNQNLAKGFALERGQGGWSFFQGGPRNGAFRINVVQ